MGGTCVTQHFDDRRMAPSYSIFMRSKGLVGRGGSVLWDEPELAVDSEKVTEQWEQRLW